jgi:CheY-like chemotaxis protein
MSAIDDRNGMSARSAYVLDDDAAVRAFVARVLTKNGFETLQFSSPSPMLVRLKVAPPELVILDLALGNSDALDVMRQLEVLKYTGKLLLISGRDEGTLLEFQRIGERHGLTMLPSLVKPFRPDELRYRIMAVPHIPPSVATADDHDGTVMDLGQALREQWLELWYQPKIDLKTLSVCGAEALLRARHREHGILPPAALLPPASDPLHQPLFSFVIGRAMSDWDHFAKVGMPLRLAINSPISVIHAPAFINVVREALPSDPRFPGLIIEITEDEIIRDPDLIHEISMQLKL